MNFILCWQVLPILLTCCASTYLTSLLCRLAKWRHRSVRLYFSFLGAFGAGVLAVLFVWLGLTIPRGEVGNFEASAFLGSMFLEVAGCALVPAFAVAWFHRRRHVVAA